MPRAMIVSVGTGTRPDVNIVNPLVKTVKDTDPKLVSFFVSKESEVFAEEVARQSGLQPGDSLFALVHNENDIQECFHTALQALHELRDKGYKPEDIIVDFTSGTKAMTAGLVLAAVNLKCAKLKYIYGPRENGVVKDGTEKFLSVSPAAALAVSELELARQLIMQLRFEAARGILSQINDALLVPEDKALKENLQLLADAYARWDHFDHRTFCGQYGKVRWGHPELEAFKVENSLPHGRLIPLAKKLENGEITLDCLADLYNNALRRGFEGRYDDGVARLYRLTEMLAQYRLCSSHGGIRTGDIDLNSEPLARLDSQTKEELERYRDASDGKIKIGLKQSYWLLEKLGDPLGKAYFSDDKLGGLLNERNASILAHGTKPVSKEVFESLQQRVFQLLAEADAEFQSRCVTLQFPWLRDLTPEPPSRSGKGAEVPLSLEERG